MHANQTKIATCRLEETEKNKIKEKNSQNHDISPLRGYATCGPTPNKFGVCEDLTDVVTNTKIGS